MRRQHPLPQKNCSQTPPERVPVDSPGHVPGHNVSTPDYQRIMVGTPPPAPPQPAPPRPTPSTPEPRSRPQSGLPGPPARPAGQAPGPAGRAGIREPLLQRSRNKKADLPAEAAVAERLRSVASYNKGLSAKLVRVRLCAVRQAWRAASRRLPSPARTATVAGRIARHRAGLGRAGLGPGPAP